MKLLYFVVNLVAWLAIPASEPQLAIQGLDPVMLIAGEETPGRQSLTIHYGRFTYRFATAESRGRFQKDPERYAVQIQGACPVRPDLEGRPEIFLVHDGKIYFFYSEECRGKFEKEPEHYLEALEKSHPASPGP